MKRLPLLCALWCTCAAATAAEINVAMSQVDAGGGGARLACEVIGDS